MRPFVLDPLFKPLSALPGIGPRLARLYEKLAGGPKILDLLWHLPVEWIDRRHAPCVAEAMAGQLVTLRVRVHAYQPAARPGQPFRVLCGDRSGTITIVFFNAKSAWVEKTLPKDAEIVVSGRVELYDGRLQMVHPEAIGSPEEFDAIAVAEPVYSLTQGLSNRQVRKAAQAALTRAPALEEWNDPAWVARNGWSGWRESLGTVHAPQDGSYLTPVHPARRRLAYDELLANQLALALVRSRQRRKAGVTRQGTGHLRSRMIASLPFRLTDAQNQALSEIGDDMAAPCRMLRLLQGDVGSGKTVVAALAMLQAVESGGQAVLMAPTEILARQHRQSLEPWCTAAGVQCALLTGRSRSAERADTLKRIKDGSAQIVVGTHALFQEDVAFADLALAVIDEQHRFGVHQRLMLSAKGRWADILVMTATPIPRTLALTAYGDMDISVLREKPPGRRPVDTRLIPVARLEEMVAGLGRKIAQGARAYWVCPLVEESESVDLEAAQTRHAFLQERFGNRVGLVHGKLPASEKDAVMEAFARGVLDILVATTVIEVGVNVPEATVMVVEHAERFGLAQLHQLRGRVGRGADRSYCFLVYSPPLGETASERLSTLKATEDGFVIAEKDLALRGGGEMLGTRQSGLPRFCVADLSCHADLLAVAEDDAKLILARDPELETPRGKALRTLLYLFERDQAVLCLRSG